MSTIRRDRIRFAAAGLFIMGAIIIGVSGIVPPTAYDPSTQLYRHAKQPMQTQMLLYEHRHACWVLSGVCFAASAALALVARGKKRRIANIRVDTYFKSSIKLLKMVTHALAQGNEMEIIKVHGERRKQRILILILAPMFFATGAFGIYLDFSRETDFWAPLAGISSVIVFGCIGLYCERKILRRFKCPKCGTHIPQYQLDENSLVSYQCQQCNVKYDTGFSIDHGT